MNSIKLLLQKNPRLLAPKGALFYSAKRFMASQIPPPPPQSGERRKPRNKQKESMKKMLYMAPHLMLAGLFMSTANSHLLMIPFITGGVHWMLMNRHFTKMTLYYDLHQMSNNPNVVATYGKIRELLLTDPQFSLYINQPLNPDEDSKDLIIENPVFQPFSYKLQGMTGRLDDKRRRFQFDCAFRDLSKDTRGKIQSLIIFNDKNEAYFESLTVFLDKPIEKTIRVAQSEIEDNDDLINKLNRPRKHYTEPQPQEQPKSKYRQY